MARQITPAPQTVLEQAPDRDDTETDDDAGKIPQRKNDLGIRKQETNQNRGRLQRVIPGD